MCKLKPRQPGTLLEKTQKQVVEIPRRLFGTKTTIT